MGVGVAPVIGIPKVGVSCGIGVSGVEVGVSGGIGVSVGVTGVLVGSCVSVGVIGVFVGGMGVRVGGTAVLVGGTGVFVGSRRGRRVGVGPLTVGNRKAVGVRGATVAVGLDVIVGGMVGVDVATSSENACIVSAPAVFKLEAAESMMSPGAKATAVWAASRSCIAIPETEHNRLRPSAPATKTARRPRYSLIFTLVALLSTDKLSHRSPLNVLFLLNQL